MSHSETALEPKFVQAQAPTDPSIRRPWTGAGSGSIRKVQPGIDIASLYNLRKQPLNKQL